jgi:hypothetical protein
MEFIIAPGIFGLVAGFLYYVLAARVPIADDAIQRRLETLSVQSKETARIRLYETEEQTLWERIAEFFLGTKEMPARYTRLSWMLHQAGYRGERAIRFWGLRIFSVWHLASEGF